jgi:predicted phage terminase large subunit-like protein
MTTSPPHRDTVTDIEVEASVCRDSFFQFVKRIWAEIIPEQPVWNWHIEVICYEMQKLAERAFLGLDKEYDLVINVPPGSTKSTICSIMFPAWVWARRPEMAMICVSYSSPLSLHLGLKSKDIVLSEKYRTMFPNVVIRRDKCGAGEYWNTMQGKRFATSTGGTVTGMHGDFVITDDPLNPEEAASPTELKKANTWLNSTLSSRIKDKRRVPTILIMQRLHEDDPTARMIKGKSPVRHICLPAEVDSTTLKDIKPRKYRKQYSDGLLDVERMNRKSLDEAKDKLGEYEYACQYLQRPVPPSGGTFKVGNLKIQDPPFSFVHKVRYWDKAGTLDGGCYTAGVLMGEDLSGRIWVLDVIKFQLDSFEREKMIKLTAQVDGVEVEVGIEQEGGSGGKQSAEETVKMLAGFAVTVDAPTGDKEFRAIPFSKQVNGGNVYLVPGDWNKEYIGELSMFPRSKYKDQVDASSGAFKLLTAGNVIGVIK